ncbi:MAG: DUF6691 family protein [Steroidobacteraceae bacterium]
MKAVAALVAGLLFGSGLLLSGMTNPANVLAFLDVGGDWNPALALTMAGAIAVAAPAFLFLRRRHLTLRGEFAVVADKGAIDRPLLVGSMIFGLGWGLSGICPGPGLVLLAGLTPAAFVFVAAMLAGMFAGMRLVRHPTPKCGSDVVLGAPRGSSGP